MVIPLMNPKCTQEMKDAATYALENEFYVLGESVHKFEEEFARFIGTKYAVSTGSGSSALQFSLLALGLKPGEKVITAPNSFIASSNCVIHASGVPKFCDIDASTGNLDPARLESADKSAKGLIPVHLYGQACDLQPVMEFAEKKGMFVLEDACQAHGTTYKGKNCGSIGDAGCFSFYSSKNLTVAGDGGMMVTNNEEIAAKVKKLRDCGRTSKYEHDEIGYTSRLNTVNAAIGRVQLKHLEQDNERRQQLANIYRKLLPEEVVPLEEKSYGKPVYHLFVVKVANRDVIAAKLKENGIQTGIHYPIPIHLQPVYRKLFGYKEGDFPVSEAFARDILSLPMFPELKEEEVKFVCEKIGEAVEK